MKKIATYLFILIVSVVLSGCSIPLGDLGTLDISKDGVNVVVDGENSESENSDGAEDDEEDGEQIAVDSNVGTVDEEDEDEDKKDDGNKAESVSSSYVCNELIKDQRGNERALKKVKELLPPNFLLADCIFIESTNEGRYGEADTLDLYFQVDGYWADIYDEYTEYLNDAGFGPLSLSENTKDMAGSIVGKTPDYKLDMYLNQRGIEDAEVTAIRIVLYHYDEPRE